MTDTTITLTRRWPHEIEEILQQEFDVRLNTEDRILDANEILRRCEGADILCPTITDTIDSDLIRQLPGTVRLIANYGAGIDRINIAAAIQRGIMVTNTPGVVVDDTADLAIGLMIAASRRFSEGDFFARTKPWEKFSLDFMLGRSVHGKTLGLIGMGDIGTAVARRASGFNMHILYHNRHRNIAAERELGAVYCSSLQSLLNESDIVSLHCPLTSETRHLINSQSIKWMKPGVILINTARGPVVDEEALAEALENGDIAAAGLDVYENEPDINERLRQLSNTVLIPHLGTATYEARMSMGLRVIENIRCFLRDGHPPDVVSQN